ncbi:MAG: hypothetical protein M3018_05105, partial [Actinomycetota bacterium]|nr:hypothetical protein [Actinomycetota bacterium]
TGRLVMGERGVHGRGTLRVGQFIGRLGVVSLPAIGAGLDLDERVVRRHVARLEAAGWVGRMPWVWGEGSVAWLTSTGLRGAGLGGVRVVKAPPSATTVSHAVLVAWSAARMERRGLRWQAARVLEAESDRWAVRMRDERGYRKQLPDLAVWRRGAELPVAIVGEEGHRREDRQRLILEGWRDAVLSGRYIAVQYDCASAPVAARMARLAKKVHFTRPEFITRVQARGDEIAAIAQETEIEDPAPTPHAMVDSPEDGTADGLDGRRLQLVLPPAPSTAIKHAPPPAAERDESPEEVAERERQYREIMGIPEPKPRRPWRR